MSESSTPATPAVPDPSPLDFGESDLAAVVAALNGGAAVADRRGVAGGDINAAARLTLDDGTALFLKSNHGSDTGPFREEARGLLALARSPVPRVVRPRAFFTDGRQRFLILEHIDGRPRAAGVAERFGRELATLHRTVRADASGFPHDNWCGSTPQPNGWISDWHEFFAERRLRFQVRLARERGRADAEMERAVDRLGDRLPELLAPPDDGRPSLLHGDLWGGNYLVGESGEPVLIDPAAYFGHREADLAMTELFGGFGAGFYDAYRETWPLEPGYAERRDIYNLYHLLNHLNLFGGGYAGSCWSILRRYG